MVNVKISALPAGGAIDGTEFVPMVQAGATVKNTTQAIRGPNTFIGTGANSGEFLQTKPSGFGNAATFSEINNSVTIPAGTFGHRGDVLLHDFLTSDQPAIVGDDAQSALADFSGYANPTVASQVNLYGWLNRIYIDATSVGDYQNFFGFYCATASYSTGNVQDMEAFASTVTNNGTGTLQIFEGMDIELFNNGPWQAPGSGTQFDAYSTLLLDTSLVACDDIYIHFQGLVKWTTAPRNYHGIQSLPPQGPQPTVSCKLFDGPFSVPFTIASGKASIELNAATIFTDANCPVLPNSTVGALPAGQPQGAMAFVTDATLTAITGLGTVAVGGGANKVPVYFDGANWIIL